MDVDWLSFTTCLLHGVDPKRWAHGHQGWDRWQRCSREKCAKAVLGDVLADSLCGLSWLDAAWPCLISPLMTCSVGWGNLDLNWDPAVRRQSAASLHNSWSPSVAMAPCSWSPLEEVGVGGHDRGVLSVSLSPRACEVEEPSKGNLAALQARRA